MKKNLNFKVKAVLLAIVLSTSIASCNKDDDFSKFYKKKSTNQKDSIDSSKNDSMDSTRRDSSDTSGNGGGNVDSTKNDNIDSSRNHDSDSNFNDSSHLPDVVLSNLYLDAYNNHIAVRTKYVYSYSDRTTGVRYYKKYSITVPWYGYSLEPNGPNFNDPKAEVVEEPGFWYFNYSEWKMK